MQSSPDHPGIRDASSIYCKHTRQKKSLLERFQASLEQPAREITSGDRIARFPPESTL